MDNSYSHLAKHMSQGDVLQDMTAGKPAFPIKPLDKAVVAHMGVARLKTGSEWHQHCAFRGVEISPVGVRRRHDQPCRLAQSNTTVH